MRLAATESSLRAKADDERRDIARSSRISVQEPDLVLSARRAPSAAQPPGAATAGPGPFDPIYEGKRASAQPAGRESLDAPKDHAVSAAPYDFEGLSHERA